jgi:hypothetical protein
MNLSTPTLIGVEGSRNVAGLQNILQRSDAKFMALRDRDFEICVVVLRSRHIAAVPPHRPTRFASLLCTDGRTQNARKRNHRYGEQA